MDRKSFFWKNASSFYKKSGLDFVTVLCIDSSDLFLFGTKKAIPDIRSSN